MSAATYVPTPEPATTGRYLVLLREDAQERGVDALRHQADLEVINTADFGADKLSGEVLQEARGVVLHELGVAVVDAPPEQMQALSVSAAPGADAAVLAVEPERVVWALERPPLGSQDLFPSAAPTAGGLSRDYLRGYYDAVAHLSSLSGAVAGETAAPTVLPAWADQSHATWGLQVVGASMSSYTGTGIAVAVLDTGFDVAHPDFVGRAVTTQSLVAGAAVQDAHGHGTHCIGTACGPRVPGIPPRYGIAYEADIQVGKVLNDQGRGGDGDILAGIAWALSSKAHVVSMSLGAPSPPGRPYSQVFERAARRALAAGTLIVAAAGNDSRRDLGHTAPVGHPANCPSIMAVAALDEALQVAFFSNGGTPAGGGQVDIAAPGVDVRSSWPMPKGYNTISGTSMATPHVAGVAALLAEANPSARGADLWSLLQRTARRLPLLSTDVGAGLVQAP